MSRLLFVHAHPDDETLATGVAILHHVARGDDVHVLTCTLGEEGEVIPAVAGAPRGGRRATRWPRTAAASSPERSRSSG